MKVCPVCNSRCFDDMETCYGCMYTFKAEQNAKEQEADLTELPDVLPGCDTSVTNNTRSTNNTYDTPPPNNTYDTNDPLPEYYETYEFPIIELVEDFYNRKQANEPKNKNDKTSNNIENHTLNNSTQFTQPMNPIEQPETSSLISSNENNVVIKIIIPKQSIMKEFA